MRIINKMAVALLATVCVSGAAYAQSDIVVTKSGVGGGGGFYMGATIGNASYDEAGGDDLAVSLLGGYMLNDILGVELSWTDYGSSEIDGSTDEADAQGLSVSMIGTLPLSTELSAFAQLGVSSWDLSVGNIDVSDTDVIYGVGIDYSVTGNASVRFAYTALGMKGSSNGTTLEEDVQTISVGFIYRP